MLLTAKKLAFLGLLLAFDLLLLILSQVFEFNTLFLLGAASFCVGIAIRESNIRMGFGFFIAGVLLGVILSPDKLYCITYAAMGLYVLVSEILYDKMIFIKKVSSRVMLLWLAKYILFNLMYIPLLIFMPGLIYSGQLNPTLTVLLIIAGQAALYTYDKAYDYFQKVIWGKTRRLLKL